LSFFEGKTLEPQTGGVAKHQSEREMPVCRGRETLDIEILMALIEDYMPVPEKY